MSQVVLTNPGNVPTITVQGQPDNIDINLAPKGSGKVNASGGINATGANSFTGTTTNDAALAGQIGEYASAVVPIGSPVSLTNNTGVNAVTLELTAGDWDVSGAVNFIQTGATATAITAGITTTTITVPVDGSEIYFGPLGSELTVTAGSTLATKRISLAATTNVRLATKALFSAGTVGAFGTLTARRAR